MSGSFGYGVRRQARSDGKRSTPITDELNDSPIEEVRLTIPITDDTTLPSLTFRTWIVGPIACIFFSIMTEFFEYRQNPIPLPASCFTVLFLLIGKLMAATFPTKALKFPGTNWTFSMNPGPFSIKEHVLLTIMANAGMDRPFSLSVVVIAKAFYHKNISFWMSFLLVLTSQMIGYGFAGIFMKLLVDSPYMWWPYSVLNAFFYRMLHEEEVRPKGQLTRFQFFLLVSVTSFAYHIIPNYFFPSIAALSFVCWIWKDSVTAQQVGSGLHGLGIGSLSLDWSSITFYLGNPLVVPKFALINTMVGFILFTYLITPIAYWSDSYGAKRFPFFSSDMFDVKGQGYDVSEFVSEDFPPKQQHYNNYSAVYFSVVFIFSVGFQLGAETATLTHFFLFHARDTWNQFKQTLEKGRGLDVHNRLMQKYDPVPHWWFHAIIASMLVLALFNSMVFGEQLQLSYSGTMLGYFLGFILILPVGVISATTGQESIDMFGLSELLMGWLYPGKPLASLTFQSYCTTTLSNSLGFISEFKFGHYMKIPPKSLFIAQIVGSLISYSTNLGVTWWLLMNVENICDKNKLPEGSPWTCPGQEVLLRNSIVWAGVGQRRFFLSHSRYSKIYIFFFIGVLATVLAWTASHIFPKYKLIKQIHTPLIFVSGARMPQAAAVYYWSWCAVAVIFNVAIYRKHKGSWAKYNYLVANGLDMGVAFISLLTNLTFQVNAALGVNWWGSISDDHCPLSSCPASPGIHVDGCPAFH